jgi:hypothetical protein
MGFGGRRLHREEKKMEFGPWLRVPSLTRRMGMGGGWASGSKARHPQAANHDEELGQKRRFGRDVADLSFGGTSTGASLEFSATPVKGGPGEGPAQGKSPPHKLMSANHGILQLRDEENLDDGDFGKNNYGNILLPLQTHERETTMGKIWILKLWVNKIKRLKLKEGRISMWASGTQ